MSEQLTEMAQVDLDAESEIRDESVKVMILQKKGEHTISSCIPVHYASLTNAEANGLGLLVAVGAVKGIVDVILPLARQKAENLNQQGTWEGLELMLRRQIKAWGDSMNVGR